MHPLKPQLPAGASFASTSALRTLAEYLKPLTSIAVLTGAGISTESGLSDYRSPGKQKLPRPPIRHQDYVSSASVRRRYWARSFVGFPVLSRAQPGLAHRALAALHDRGGGRFGMHITQNVDGLLQAARMPTKRLVELHGSIHGLVCRRCGVRESREAFQIRLEEMNEVWARELGRYEHRPDGDADLKGDFIERFQVGGCTGCGEDALMPSLVFHGGGVPKDVSETCMDIVEGCDGLVVIGSTVTPYSAFRLVRKAKERGLFVGCVNFGDTRADGMYDCKVEGLVGNAVARLADMMLVGGYGDEEGFEGVLKADEDFVVRRLEL